jgi:hypothetical protein
LPRDQTGEIAEIAGERVVGEYPAEYQARLVDVIPGIVIDVDAVIRAHGRNLFARRAPPRPAFNTNRSLRRVS